MGNLNFSNFSEAKSAESSTEDQTDDSEETSGNSTTSEADEPAPKKKSNNNPRMDEKTRKVSGRSLRKSTALFKFKNSSY